MIKKIGSVFSTRLDPDLYSTKFLDTDLKLQRDDYKTHFLITNEASDSLETLLFKISIIFLLFDVL